MLVSDLIRWGSVGGVGSDVAIGFRSECRPLLRRNFYGGFRHTLGGSLASLETDKKGVLANGDDIFTGQAGFGNRFIIQQGTVGAVQILDDIIAILPGNGGMLFRNTQIVDMNITIIISANGDGVFIGFDRFKFGVFQH
jgi:hypothetical protein